MRTYIRLHKGERMEDMQTLFDHELQIAAHLQSLEPSMFLKIVNSLGLIVPSATSPRVEPDNIYIRRTSRGTEFVRKREQNNDKMCKHRELEPRERHQSLAQKQASLLKRKKQLEAELAAAVAAAEEVQRKARIGIREPRPYHLSAEPREQDTSEISPGALPKRRKSVRIEVPEPEVRYSERRRCSRRQNQSSHQDYDFDVPHYTVKSPETGYFVREAVPVISPRHHGRRCSRQHSSCHQRREEIPMFYQEIIIPRRARTNPGPCRRRSRHYGSTDAYDWEIRAPEDYLYEY